MSLLTFDRVKETTTTTGTGTLTLAGAVTGFRTFASVLAANDLCYYCVALGSEWEVGLGTFNTTLARTTVIASSNAGALVNFSAGSKEVWITAPASRLGDTFYIKQGSNYTLANVATEQKAFNVTTNGALALPTGMYHFDFMLFISVMSATSGNAAFDPLGAGTAVCSEWMWGWYGIDNTNAMGTAASPTAGGANTQQTPASAVTAQTGTAMRLKGGGTVEITTAGTMIPSVTLVTAVATALVNTGSYFLIRKIGETGQQSFGHWT